MSQKIRRHIVINGEEHWISSNSEQEYAEKILRLSASPFDMPKSDKCHDFEDYAWRWYEVFSKPNVSLVTGMTYFRQLKRYIIPALKGKMIENITTEDVQLLFNNMGSDLTKATKEKTRIVLNMIFNHAYDDKLIDRNPMKSPNLRIKGKASSVIEPYSVEEMRYLVSHIDVLQNEQDRMYIALSALHPLRPEEVLGLQWSDIDFDAKCIYVRRAVTHPYRNSGLIGEPKTKTSKRVICLVPYAAKYLCGGSPDAFILGGDTPLSYSQVRRMCERIQRELDFPVSIVPRRFRTTVLTDLYNITKDIKTAQAAAGHTTAAMTLKYYVKGRPQNSNTAVPISVAYGLESAV